MWGRVITAALFSRSTREFYDKIAPVYDQLFVSHRLHAENMARMLADVYAGRENKALILDLGCGTGVVSGILAARGFRTLGLDVSLESLRLLPQKTRDIHAVQADAALLPFTTDSFDAVVSLGAWRHFPDPRWVLGEIARVLKYPGLVVIGYFPPALGGVLAQRNNLWFRSLARLYRFCIRRRGYVDHADASLESDTIDLAREYFAQVSAVSSGARCTLVVARHLKQS